MHENKIFSLFFPHQYQTAGSMHTEQIVNLRIMGEFNTGQLWKDLPTVTRNANWVGEIEYNYC